MVWQSWCGSNTRNATNQDCKAIGQPMNRLPCITIRKQHQTEKEDMDKAMLSAIQQYIEITLSPYMKDAALTLLYNNVYLWYHSKKATLVPVCTDGTLSTLDLRHLVWNIGERCGWKGEQRARFIKQSFPSELKDVEVETIRRNMRQKGTCKIEIDVPENGSFEEEKEMEREKRKIWKVVSIRSAKEKFREESISSLNF